MPDYANTTWVEQSTGLTVEIEGLDIVERECPYRDTFDGPILWGSFEFRTYSVPAVEGSELFSGGAYFDEDGLTGYINRGILVP